MPDPKLPRTRTAIRRLILLGNSNVSTSKLLDELESAAVRYAVAPVIRELRDADLGEGYQHNIQRVLDMLQKLGGGE